MVKLKYLFLNISFKISLLIFGFLFLILHWVLLSLNLQWLFCCQIYLRSSKDFIFPYPSRFFISSLFSSWLIYFEYFCIYCGFSKLENIHLPGGGGLHPMGCKEWRPLTQLMACTVKDCKNQQGRYGGKWGKTHTHKKE